MLTLQLTEWLGSPETKALRLCLRQRQAATLQTFLAGHLVTPAEQGRAAAFHELETLLAKPADKVQEVFDAALKEVKT